MIDRTTSWMLVSGLTGFTLFCIANRTEIFFQLEVVAGVLQILVNIFVFVSFRNGYRVKTGFMRTIARIGTIVPVGMAIITIYRVLIPFFFT